MAPTTRAQAHKPAHEDAAEDDPKAKTVKLCISELMKQIGEFGAEREANVEPVLQVVTIVEEMLFGGTSTLPQKKSFSDVPQGDINKFGINYGALNVNPDRVRAAIASMNADARREVEVLRRRLVHQHIGVDLKQEAGARFLINAVLETVRIIARDPQSNLEVAILPELRIAAGEGITVRNLNAGSRFELRLTGVVDYAVVRYRTTNPATKEYITGTSATLQSILHYSEGCAFLVEAKRNTLVGLRSSLPEAISQAFAWAELTKRTEVHFCLTSGQRWIFCVLRLEGLINGFMKPQWMCYTSPEYRLSDHELETPDHQSLLEIIQMVMEWSNPNRRFYTCTPFSEPWALVQRLRTWT